MSVGRLTASLLSATNENTLALANLNFDFALVKFDAPPEFNALGAALTTRRRNDAERGSTHKTARRLGALFEQLVPPTPQLIKAYGLRVSQVAETPGINPTGTTSDGPFQAFSGADGTSIWAAATSGGFKYGVHAPIAVHLLACILARAWEAKTATSIWAELVHERQKQLEDTSSSSNNLSAADVMAARQEITREQLALWDASARSWLRSADEAKFKEQKKLLLITKNIGLPVTGGETTYQKVITAWKQAMIGFEDIIGGMPLQISHGTMLLALSSWHLYPDLIVMGGQAKNVQFHDPLVPDSGVITVGLLHNGETEDQAIRWSLTLSHLYYYGDPVQVTSAGCDTRVTIQQLHVVVLGGLFRAWGVSISTTIDAVNWIMSLWNTLHRQDSGRRQQKQIRWIHGLVIASQSLLRIKADDEDLYKMLLNFGRRRGKDFLGAMDDDHRPFFGLCNPYILTALKEPDERECGIRYLREVARSLGFQSDDAIICVSWNKEAATWHEYVTAVPHKRKSQKRLQDGTIKLDEVHARWITASLNDSNRCRCYCPQLCDATCMCAQTNGLCGTLCHSDGPRLCQKFSQESDSEYGKATARGEEFLYIEPFYIHSIDTRVDSLLSSNIEAGRQPQEEQVELKHQLIWKNPPKLFHNDKELAACPEECPSIKAQGPCHCFEPCFTPCNFFHEVLFTSANVSMDGFKLYLRVKHNTPPHSEPSNNPKKILIDAMKANSSPIESTKIFETGALDCHQLSNYLATVLLSSPPYVLGASMQTSNLRNLLVGTHYIRKNHHKSLRALSLATRVYQTLEGATIPLSILSIPLHLAKWIPNQIGSILDIEGAYLKTSAWNMADDDDDEEYEDDDDTDDGDSSPLPEVVNNEDSHHVSVGANFGAKEELSRQNIFSCIAMFEAGIDVDPQGLQDIIAMAWENSIFVLDLLLADPSDKKSSCRIKRIIGNVGRHGLTMMVAPDKPRIRAPSNSYSLVNHHGYDGKREDNFRHTSLHLSFTQWNVPQVSATVNQRGAIDQDVFFLESVVSVHDCGKWVADLDLLKLLDSDFPEGRSYATFETTCSHEPVKCTDESYTSIDSWDELLDLPESIGVLRARDNWVARLAAVSILTQKNEATAIVLQGNRICWGHFQEMFGKELKNVVLID